MFHVCMYSNDPILGVLKPENKNIDRYVLILVPWYPVILIKEKKGIDVKRCGGTYINKEDNEYQHCTAK